MILWLLYSWGKVQYPHIFCKQISKTLHSDIKSWLHEGPFTKTINVGFLLVECIFLKSAAGWIQLHNHMTFLHRFLNFNLEWLHLVLLRIQIKICLCPDNSCFSSWVLKGIPTMEGAYGRRDTATMLMSALSGWYKSSSQQVGSRRKFARFRDKKVRICYKLHNIFTFSKLFPLRLNLLAVIPISKQTNLNTVKNKIFCVHVHHIVIFLLNTLWIFNFHG